MNIWVLFHTAIYHMLDKVLNFFPMANEINLISYESYYGMFTEFLKDISWFFPSNYVLFSFATIALVEFSILNFKIIARVIKIITFNFIDLT
jgi:hypothetical protein